MKKYINQYRTETIRGENNKKIRNVIYTGDYYKITKEKTARKVFFIVLLTGSTPYLSRLFYGASLCGRAFKYAQQQSILCGTSVCHFIFPGNLFCDGSLYIQQGA